MINVGLKLRQETFEVDRMYNILPSDVDQRSKAVKHL